MSTTETCRECGQPRSDHTKKRWTFCTPQCRMAWHNRRRDRGAELYDVLMAWRYERDRTDCMAQLARLASAYHAADTRLRDGRRSWNLDEALQRLPLAFGRDGDGR